LRDQNEIGFLLHEASSLNQCSFAKTLEDSFLIVQSFRANPKYNQLLQVISSIY